ncbi:MAG: dihydrodipicolinate reductase [Rhodothermales bacterium]|nr:dihydrodipicolinate reductase [Rhodothermales bacterium]
MPIRVVQYGLGPIGVETARVLLDKQAAGHVRLVGAIDIDPDKAGRDLAELLGREATTGIVVDDDADRVLAQTLPDVVVHTTSSFLDRVMLQLVRCIEAGAHVVSSTEELAYPFERHPVRSHTLDATAKRHGVAVLGTGVNPGYAMDTLALSATGVCTDVTHLRAERVVDAGKRRAPLQRKVGAGITVEEFEARKATGTFGHIGLRESMLLVADGLGWTFDRVEETLEPMRADRDIETPYSRVEAGSVAGIHHAITGFVGEEPLVELDLKMYVGAEDPHDAVQVTGTPPVRLVVPGGIFGDTATVAALVNAVPLVRAATPGLRTTKDLPVPRCFAPTGVAEAAARTA